MAERTPHWQRVRTDAGWHLRLVGGNGEPVLTSEVYTDQRTVEEALRVVTQALTITDHAVTATAWLVDERTTPRVPQPDRTPGAETTLGGPL